NADVVRSTAETDTVPLTFKSNARCIVSPGATPAALYACAKRFVWLLAFRSSTKVPDATWCDVVVAPVKFAQALNDNTPSAINAAPIVMVQRPDLRTCLPSMLSSASGRLSERLPLTDFLPQ